MSKLNNYFTGVVLCLIATLSWGFMFPIMTHALANMDPFTFTTIRFTIIALAFVVFQYIKEGPASFRFDGNVFLLWVLGSIGFAGFGFFVFLGQQLAGAEGALSASIMMATMPLMGLFGNWMLQGVRPTGYSFAFVGLSFLGVLLVITKGDLAAVSILRHNMFANILMISGPFFWVIYTLGSIYYPRWSPVKYTTLSVLLSLTTIYLVEVLLVLTGKISLPSISVIMHTLPELLYMALVAGFIGFFCWNMGNKIITPVNGVVFMAVVPVAAFALSTIEGVVPTRNQLIGVLLATLALILNNIYQRRLMINAHEVT